MRIKVDVDYNMPFFLGKAYEILKEVADANNGKISHASVYVTFRDKDDGEIFCIKNEDNQEMEYELTDKNKENNKTTLVSTGLYRNEEGTPIAVNLYERPYTRRRGVWFD